MAFYTKLVVVLCGAFVASLPVDQPVGFMLGRGHQIDQQMAFKNKELERHVAFEEIINSAISDFNPMTGVFYGIIPGIYFFSFMAAAPEDGPELKISLRKNGDVVKTAVIQAGFSGSVSKLVQIAKGDRIYPFIDEGIMVDSREKGESLVTFTGYRLSSKDDEEEPTPAPEKKMMRRGWKRVPTLEDFQKPQDS